MSFIDFSETQLSYLLNRKSDSYCLCSFSISSLGLVTGPPPPCFKGETHHGYLDHTILIGLPVPALTLSTWMRVEGPGWTNHVIDSKNRIDDQSSSFLGLYGWMLGDHSFLLSRMDVSLELSVVLTLTPLPASSCPATKVESGLHTKRS